MGEIVNLRRVRKTKARAEAAEAAAMNRARTGQTKAVRKATEHERGLNARALDGARIVKPVDG